MDIAYLLKQKFLRQTFHPIMMEGDFMELESGRRDFMKKAAGIGAALAFSSATNSLVFAKEPSPGPAAKTITMVQLPYAKNGLEPTISSRTVDLHYNKHHTGYYKTLKAYVNSHPDYQNQTLEELIAKNRNGILLDESIFDISVLVYNHNWYWQSLKSKAGGVPKGKIGKMIVESYGSFEAFRSTFIGEAMELGVGWVWVVQDGTKILVYRSDYNDTPLVKGVRPLLAVDVWEHAYYLDYQNERQKYVEAVLGNLLNWEFAEKNLA
jgi:Fe-Mn family superoxide dismutase